VVVRVEHSTNETISRRNLPGLFAYAENGGTLIVQYNRPTGLRRRNSALYPLSIAGNARNGA